MDKEKILRNIFENKELIMDEIDDLSKYIGGQFANDPIEKVFKKGYKTLQEKLDYTHIQRFMCIDHLDNWLQKAKEKPIGLSHRGVGTSWSWSELDWRSLDTDNTGRGMEVGKDCKNIVKLKARDYQHTIDVPYTMYTQYEDMWKEDEVKLKENTDDVILLESIILEDTYEFDKYEKIGEKIVIDNEIMVDPK